MVLAIDIGNSNIVLGGYTNGQSCFMARLATNRHLEADQYAVELGGILRLYDVQDNHIEGMILSSVVPGLTPVVKEALMHYSPRPPVVFSLANAGDIQVDIETPDELGMDILASAVAVKHSYPLPAVIIDMGTATKLTALDADGRLRGVAISPGLFVSLEALVGSASLLRGIALDAPPAAIGRNTPQSMQSGVVLGTAAMLDGMIDRFKQEMGGLASVVATGGAAPTVVPHCRHHIHISNTLLLDGLYHAYCRLQKEA